MGYIYIIKSPNTNKVYIGQTTRSLKRRYLEHQRYAVKLRDDPSGGYKGSLNKLYRSMVKHGIDTFVIEMICEAPNEQLDELEIKYIKEYDSFNNGLNSTNGGSGCTPDNIEIMKKGKLVGLDRHRTEKLQGFPPCTTYDVCPRSGELVRLQQHPLCAYKLFTVKKYGSLDNVREAVCKFVKELETNGVRVEKKPKLTVDGQPGFYRSEISWYVQAVRNGTRYNKHFKTKEEAQEYYNTLPKSIRTKSND